MTSIALAPSSEAPVLQPGRLALLFRYIRRNKSLAIGLIVLALLVLFTILGLLLVDPKSAYPLTAPTKRPPSLQFPLGTDFFGRNLLAAMAVGMWQTAVIGVLAGGIGTVIGVILG